MTQPDDAKDVIAALRLGWSLAEVRGRSDKNKQPDHELAGYALPLQDERTNADLQKEAIGLLGSLGTQLSLGDLAQSRAQITDAVDDWDTVRKVIYALDSQVQNALIQQSEQKVCAYQLGRGLAEAYWALDRNVVGRGTQDPTSWNFLLGDRRSKELSRLAGRLADYFNPYTAPALSGSLAIWSKVVETGDWLRVPDQPTEEVSDPTTDPAVLAEAKLCTQVTRWHELLVLGQDPTTLIKPFGLLRNFKTAWNSFRMFFPQIIGGIVGIFALSAAAWAAQSGTAQALLTTFGVSGVSLSALHAKAKSSAQGLTKRLEQDAYTDLISSSITEVPPRDTRELQGQRRTFSRTRRAMNSALTTRSITAAEIS